MFQITDALDKYKSSLEKIGKALDGFSDNALLNKVYFLEFNIFSFLTGNNDIHIKKKSIIHYAKIWTLAPAYDLLNSDRKKTYLIVF
jgi:serine/threonine-protein kinase HipA